MLRRSWPLSTYVHGDHCDSVWGNLGFCDDFRKSDTYITHGDFTQYLDIETNVVTISKKRCEAASGAK